MVFTVTNVFCAVRVTGRTTQYFAPLGRSGPRQSGVLVIRPVSLMCPTWTSASGVFITSAWENRRVMVAASSGLVERPSAWA